MPTTPRLAQILASPPPPPIGTTMSGHLALIFILGIVGSLGFLAAGLAARRGILVGRQYSTRLIGTGLVTLALAGGGLILGM